MNIGSVLAFVVLVPVRAGGGGGGSEAEEVAAPAYEALRAFGLGGSFEVGGGGDGGGGGGVGGGADLRAATTGVSLASFVAWNLMVIMASWRSPSVRLILVVKLLHRSSRSST